MKVLRAEIAAVPGTIERFRREVRLARRVTHPNVARVYDIGEQGGQKILTMELVDGEPLSALLRREGALPATRAIEVTCAIAAGVGAAHAAGVIHRDLKPDNVLLAKDGRHPRQQRFRHRARRGGQRAGADRRCVRRHARVHGARAGGGHHDRRARGHVRVRRDALRDRHRHAAVAGRVRARGRRRAPHPPAAGPAGRFARTSATRMAELVLRCPPRAGPTSGFCKMSEIATALAAITPTTSLPTARAAAADRARRGRAPPTAKRVAAVLPFRNSGAPEHAYLAEALTDDLIDLPERRAASCACTRARHRGPLPQHRVGPARGRARARRAGRRRGQRAQDGERVPDQRAPDQRRGRAAAVGRALRGPRVRGCSRSTIASRTRSRPRSPSSSRARPSELERSRGRSATSTCARASSTTAKLLRGRRLRRPRCSRGPSSARRTMRACSPATSWRTRGRSTTRRRPRCCASTPIAPCGSRRRCPTRMRRWGPRCSTA